MITAIVGVPGGGKSLKAAYGIIRDLKRGINVITNYAVDLSKYSKRFEKRYGSQLYCMPEDITVRDVVLFALEHHVPMKEHQTHIYLDEPRFLDPRKWRSGDRSQWVEFMRLHRKFFYDVIIITQSEMLIDSQIRDFIEIRRSCRNIKYYKTFGWIVSLLCGGNLFTWKDTWMSSRSNLKIASGFYILNRRKARIYDTFYTFGSFDKLCEELLFENLEQLRASDDSPCSDVSS